MSPALEGGFLTTGPPGRSLSCPVLNGCALPPSFLSQLHTLTHLAIQKNASNTTGNFKKHTVSETLRSAVRHFLCLSNHVAGEDRTPGSALEYVLHRCPAWGCSALGISRVGTLEVPLIVYLPIFPTLSLCPFIP